MTDIFKIDHAHPQDEIIGKAVKILRDGGVIAYPTETFYGLAADAENEQAIKKIFHVKGREFRNPIALIIGDEKPLDGLVNGIPPVGRLLADTFWPGPLTLVMQAKAAVSPRLTAGSGKVGIWISSHPLAKALAIAFGGAITATSANLSGASECRTAQEVLDQLKDSVDAVLDGGITPGGAGSTFVDITTEPVTVLREGAIPAALIRSRINA
jgi:L-threonylcarbamoyladenylate synthase